MTNKELFMLDKSTSIIFLGAMAGGGKTQALLDKCKELIVDGNARICLMKYSLPDLRVIGGILDMALEQFPALGGVYNPQGRQWNFPSGAVVVIRHKPDDLNNLASMQCSHIMIDEVTQGWSEAEVMFMLSRVRSAHYTGVCQMILGGNPNKESFMFKWVEDLLNADATPFKYITQITKKLCFRDNAVLFNVEGYGSTFKFYPLSPYENKSLPESYVKNLEALPNKEYAKYALGAWV